MANNVGSLRVLLGLDAAEFTRGLTKAEYQAQQFSRNINQTILQIGKVLGGLAIGREVFEATKAIIGEAAALNDLADATGSSVEALSRLNNQARIAGTDFQTLQTLVLKLSAGMAGTDEQSTKAKEALKALGITTRDPVQALQEAAQKLTNYADGVNKVGLAVALFGKQGGQFLATLKDIAELQDVGATVTAKQAAEAEALEKAYRRLGVEAEGFKNIILSGVVPALLESIEEFREATKVAGGFWEALKAGASLNPFDTTAVAIANLRGELKRLNSTDGTPRGLSEVLDAEDRIKRINVQLGILDARQKRETRGLFGDQFLDSRDLRVRGPTAKDEAPALKSEAKAIREKVSEAERYLESLRRQLDGTLDLSAAEQVLRDVQTGRFKDATSAQITVALGIAQEIDANKAAKKAADEYADAQKRMEKARDDYLDGVRRSIDAAKGELDSINQGNEQMREQIILLNGGQDALDAYMKAKLLKVAGEKEDHAAMILAATGQEEVAKVFRDQAAALRERARLIGDTQIAEQLKREAEAVASLKSDAFDIVGRSIEDLIVNGGKASDILKQLEKDLVAFITRQALMGIKNSAMGGGSDPGNLFNIAMKFLPLLFGGGGGGVPGVGFSGGGFGEHFAAGGVSRGGLALVGEGGPELVKFNSGDRIYSNADSKRMLGGSGDIHVNQSFNVTGQIDSKTARHMAREAGAAVAMARSRG